MQIDSTGAGHLFSAVMLLPPFCAAATVALRGGVSQACLWAPDSATIALHYVDRRQVRPAALKR